MENANTCEQKADCCDHEAHVPGPIAGLTEGRIVHYVLPSGPSQGEHRPAVIVKVWNPQTGCCNLQVFTDGSNDGEEYAAGYYWATSRVHHAGSATGTWHFIERV